MFGADITKCFNEKCVLASECWRILCPREELQSYADFKPVCEDSKFEFFWEKEHGEKIRKE